MNRSCSALLLLASALLTTEGRAETSSYSRKSDGAKVLYLFLADLGYKVTREESLTALQAKAGQPTADVLVVLGRAKAADLAAAARWAERRGKRLIYAAPLEEEESGKSCQDVILGSLRITRRHKLSSEKTTRSSAYGDLKVRPSACVATAPKGASVLAKGAHGAIVFVQPFGAGKLLFFAHDSLLQNLHLDKDDLAVLLRRWLHREVPVGARVVFFEQHLGGKLWGMLQRANMVPLLAHSLLLLLLIYWSVTPRFGDPTPARPPGRRAFAEHARALGGLYERAGASSYALQQLYVRFLEKMRIRERGTKGGGAKGGGAEREQLAERLATRAGRPVEKVRSLLLQLEHAASMKGPKNKSAAAEDFRLGRALALLAGEAEGRQDERRSAD